MTKKTSTWFSGLESKEASERSPARKSDRPKLPRYPKPLREMLDQRIDALERWLRFNDLDVSWKEALDDFRQNVHMGITNPFYVMKYRDCGDIVQSAWLLNEAFVKLREYRPEDYLTEGVLSATARFNRKGKADADTPTAREELLKMGILNAPRGGKDTPGTQLWIREQVRLKTGLSESSVEKIAAKLKKDAKSQKGTATS